jgi:PAS domain S-box-containing protein
MTAGDRMALVINDDPIQVQVVRVLLESEGIRPVTFLSAEQALEHLDEFDIIDLVIVDLHMPRIDGWSFCWLLRSPEFARFNNVPILITSATFSGLEVQAVTADLGANAFLSVPFSAETFRRYLSDLLAGKRPKAEHNVLIVEEDPELRQALSEIFRLQCYRVRAVEGVSEALGLLAAFPPDVLVLEYRPSDGATRDLLEGTRRAGHHTVVLGMVGDPDPKLALTLLRAGAHGFVRKPFEPGYLVDMVHKLERQRALLRVEDVLERRNLALRTSEARYRTLFSTILEMILVLRDDGSIAQANEAAEKMLGLTGQELAARRLEDLVPLGGQGRLLKALASARASGTGVVESQFLTNDGEVLDLELSIRGLETEGKGALLLVGRDITGRKRDEAERERLKTRMQQAQKMQSLGMMAGGMAHDFNNLLVGIMGNAGLAMLELTPDHPAWESVAGIEAAAVEAAELTRQILTYAGASTVSPDELDLSKLLRDMGQLMAPAVSKKTAIQMDLKEGIPAVRGDPVQIRQIVMNLVINASEALGGKAGRITIRTGAVKANRQYLQRGILGRERLEGDYVFLEVEDDGCGMDATIRDRVFDPFFTTKFTGRGLGLAVVLGIVRGHGGDIQVEASPGMGSLFRVLLPVHESTEVQDEAPASTPGGEEATLPTVLVVDDEEAVQKVARAALEREGFRVLSAMDGREALGFLSGGREIPDVLLLDLSMPKMDGEEVLAAIRETGIEIPVILSSGYMDEAAEQRLTPLGFTGFLPKPYPPRELMEMVRSALDGGSRMQNR